MYISWKKPNVKVMKGNENYLQGNGKQFRKIFKILRDHKQVSFL